MFSFTDIVVYLFLSFLFCILMHLSVNFLRIVKCSIPDPAPDGDLGGAGGPCCRIPSAN